MPELLLAIAVALFGLLASALWFGVNRRRKAEIELGVQSLANLKWRECIGLVLQTLQHDGYQQAPSTQQPGEGSTEFLLSGHGQTVLLGYKHGTAYRLGEANVRDFANGVQMQSANSGILVTLGSVEGVARDVAKRYGVQLIDGASLWRKVQDFVAPHILARIRNEAAAQTKPGLWIGIAGSLLLGVATFLTSNALAPANTGIGAASLAEPGSASTAKTQALTDPTAEKINATAKAMAAVANLSDSERAQRRAEAAKKAGAIMQVDSAAWIAQSTLLLNLKTSDGHDTALVDEVCRILTQYEELRYTRLQLDPPANSTLQVRWRLCK